MKWTHGIFRQTRQKCRKGGLFSLIFPHFHCKCLVKYDRLHQLHIQTTGSYCEVEECDFSSCERFPVSTSASHLWAYLVPSLFLLLRLFFLFGPSHLFNLVDHTSSCKKNTNRGWNIIISTPQSTMHKKGGLVNRFSTTDRGPMPQGASSGILAPRIETRWVIGLCFRTTDRDQDRRKIKWK